MDAMLIRHSHLVFPSATTTTCFADVGEVTAIQVVNHAQPST
jgi:hypothetical protein